MRANRRRALPPSAFALPRTRQYPIDTIGRARSALARSALARSAQRNTAGTYPTVARAVRARYGDRIPTVGPTKGTTTHPGYRKGGRKNV